MFDDPYKVLGLTRDATDEQVKQAYRRLAKKYHPDINPGDPHAAKMMNDINAAYEQIKNPPQQTAYQNAYDPFSGWQYQQQSRESGPSGIQAARHFIRFGDFSSALTALAGVPESQRAAEWYYLSAVANTQLGNRVAAMEHIQRAVAMDPGNPLYRRTLEQIQTNGTVYEQQQGQVFTRGDLLCRLCSACALANFFCCGGRILPCFPFLFC